MSRRLRIGLICGTDSHVSAAAEGGIDNRGSTDLWRLAPELADDCYILHVTKNYFRRAQLHNFGSYDVLVNLVTDADVNPLILEVLARALKPHMRRVLNRPDQMRACTRDQVAAKLAGIEGLTVPKVVRIDGDKPGFAAKAIARASLRFPAILRETGTHTGRIVGVMDTAEAVTAAIARHTVYYLTEMHDARDADGLYRKYRFHSIGDAFVLRHMLTSDGWNVHTSARETYMAEHPEAREAEAAVLAAGLAGRHPRTLAILAEIKNRLGLDFFGVDCAITEDGRMLLFEANPTMNIFPFAEERRAIQEIASAAYRGMIERILPLPA